MFAPHRSTGRVKGGLSFSNSNCNEFEIMACGCHVALRDSKLGDESPVWVLTRAEFNALIAGFDAAFASVTGLLSGQPCFIDLGCGRILTIEPLAGDDFLWSLTGEDNFFVFTFPEHVALFYGIRAGQFPVEGPLLQLVEAGPVDGAEQLYMTAGVTAVGGGGRGTPMAVLIAA